EPVLRMSRNGPGVTNHQAITLDLGREPPPPLIVVPHRDLPANSGEVEVRVTAVGIVELEAVGQGVEVRPRERIDKLIRALGTDVAHAHRLSIDEQRTEAVEPYPHHASGRRQMGE